jgi:hypothetical protein
MLSAGRRFPMRTSRVFAVAFAAALLALAPLARAGELAGVKMPDTMDAGGKTLKLNGMGLRKKAIFKVYVGGLYLETPSKDASVATADVAKSMRMQFVRSVGKDKIVEGFREGFEANAKDKAAAQKANVDKLLAALPDVKDGDVVTYTYVPGKGTTVMHGDKELVAIEGKEFGDALFLVWLGPHPPTEDLKKGLLGT